ncbi:AAA family ATPase, partial [Streptomyces caeruleatus]
DKNATGIVIQQAKEEARVFMRKKLSFIWDGSNVTRQIRKQVIDLCMEYGAEVTIVYVEVPYKKLLAQNSNREHVVPAKV